jgi:hypothetical protein
MLVADDDDDFDLFQMFNGGIERPLKMCTIPASVRRQLGWQTGSIYLSRFTAQKIVHHPNHPLKLSDAMRLRQVIENGHIVTDHPRCVLFLRQSDLSRIDKVLWYYVAAALDRRHGGIFIRTFYIRTIPKKKLREMRVLMERGSPLDRWRAPLQIKQAA